MAAQNHVELQPILHEEAGQLETYDDSAHKDDSKKERSPQYTIIKSTLLILTWYVSSTMLSMWNRKLLGREDGGVFDLGPFPAPLFMSSAQFGGQICLASLALRSGLVKRHSTEVMSWRQYSRQVIPNGVATGLDIGLSNFSLALITLSFYTMCKSTTPIFLLVFCFAWGIEKPSWNLAAVVSVITVGLVLMVKGETQYNPLGFTLVMSAAMLSGLRWTITQVLLQGTGAEGHEHKGGPVEVLRQIMPVMCVTVGGMSLVAERLWEVIPNSPYFASWPARGVTAACILLGGTIAFCMVWVEFAVIQETSALTFMVAGTFKEIVTVVSAVIFLGDDFGFVNAVGLVVLIFGAGLFNYSKYQKLMEKDVIKPARSASAPASLFDELDSLERGQVHVMPSTPRMAPSGAVVSGRESVAHRRDVAGVTQLPPSTLGTLPSRNSTLGTIPSRNGSAASSTPRANR